MFAVEVALGDPNVVRCLERRGAELYRDGDAAAFVAELHRRWTARRASAPTPSEAESPVPVFMSEFVFLSYAREELAAARAVARALDDASLDVWQDELSLELGDEFNPKALRSIEEATFFVPLVSSHTASRDCASSG